MALAAQAAARPAPRAARPRSTTRAFGPLLALAAIFLAWMLMARLLPSYIFPSVADTAKEIGNLAQKGMLLSATLATVRSVVLGSVGALILGTVYGFLLFRFESFSKPFLYLLQTVPSVIWALLAIVWFGLSPGSVVFVIMIVGVPLVAINVWEGLRNVDPLLLEMAQSVEARRSMIVRHITAQPAAIPDGRQPDHDRLGLALRGPGGAVRRRVGHWPPDVLRLGAQRRA